MYYPKSKIITGLYTNTKQFVYLRTQLPFTGYYWKTSDGKFFSGINPDDIFSEEIIQITSVEETLGSPKETKNITLALPFEAPTPFSIDNEFAYSETNVLNYMGLKGIKESYRKLSPIPSYPKPTNKDYNIGEFQRYFLKKTNDSLFLEVDNETYLAIRNKDLKYDYEFYIPFSFSWQIYGNKVDIEITNRNMILLTENKSKIKGLQEFLNFEYTKYYKYPVVNNLNTKGGELYSYDNNEYVGDYHVEEENGFVIDSIPGNGPQPKLYPITKEIEKNLLNEALRAIGKFVSPLSTYDILKKAKKKN